MKKFYLKNLFVVIQIFTFVCALFIQILSHSRQLLLRIKIIMHLK